MTVISLLISGMIIFTPIMSYALLSGEEVLEIAKSSVKNWKVGEIRYKNDRTEATILLEKREIFKLKVPTHVSGKKEIEALLSDVTFGNPVLKEKKEGTIYEIPVILNGKEVGKLRIDPSSGEIMGKKPKFKLKGGSTPGHITGIIGTALVVLSQLYSFRKRKYIPFGSMPLWLHIHSYFSLIGTVLVFIHAGFPYDFKFFELKKGSLGIITTYLMIIVVISGIYGRFLYKRSKYFDRWRDIHTMIVTVLFTLIALHIFLSLGED